jgi:hypothetical protein
MAQINKPGEYFNTVLYTGNGSTQSITGVGFKPDWIWLKERSSTGNHKINDVIRGTTKYLSSNLANAEDTTGSGIQSYDSDGFSISNATDINDNTVTYASWSWLAAGTAPSKTYTVKVVDDSGNKYRFDDFGTSAVTLEISEGGTYTFDQSDSSNSGHPLRFSTTSDGTHGGGSEYTTGVTTNGTPGSAGAYTRITVAASAPTLYYYCSAHSGMGGTANTPTTNSFSNFGGSIQSNISPNTTAGFSIVSYTGTGANATVGHGLGVTPKMIIFKKRNGAPNWSVYHTSIGATKYLELNTTAAAQTATDRFNDTEPTSSVFSVGTENQTNASSGTYIAYCFAEKKGYSKFGSYTGNGNADGTFVYLGFKPAWLMIKKDGTGDNWLMYDNKINPENVMDTNLKANTSDAEATNSNHNLDFLSNGFKWRTTSNTRNGSGSTVIYMAFAEQPLVGTNNIPATAR